MTGVGVLGVDFLIALKVFRKPIENKTVIFSAIIFDVRGHFARLRSTNISVFVLIDSKSIL